MGFNEGSLTLNRHLIGITENRIPNRELKNVLNEDLKPNQNFKCPICGESLIYWHEIIGTVYHELTKDNTKYKKTIKLFAPDTNYPSGFKCSKCSFMIHHILTDEYGNITHLHDNDELVMTIQEFEKRYALEINYYREKKDNE